MSSRRILLHFASRATTLQSWVQVRQPDQFLLRGLPTNHLIRSSLYHAA